MTRSNQRVRFFRLLWPVAALGYTAISTTAFLNADLAEFVGERLVYTIQSILTVLTCFALATLLYWRARASAMALHVSYFLLGWGLMFGVPFALLEAQYGGLLTEGPLNTLVLSLLLTILLVRFPDGQTKPRWARWLIVLAALAVIGHTLYVLLRPAPRPDLDSTIGGWVNTPTFVALLISLWRYRYRATPSDRKQMKWILYGVAAFFACTIVANTVLRGPYQGVVWELGILTLPVCFAIAVLRYKLWDIDLVIRRTVQYAAVTAVLGAVYFGTVVLAQSGLVALTGQESPLAVVASTLAVAALFNPVRRRLQQWVDRAFDRRRYDAQQALAQFGEMVQNQMDVEHLQDALFDVVQETMQPESIGMWLKSEQN